jgi:LacI family transcriptional regulator
MGIAIPEQLSITGFENSPFSRQTWPRLTTANQPTQKIAEDATHLLIAKARKQTAKNVVTSYTPQLIVRDSTNQHN